jgi:ABC-type antimicrobial peptide transport system permease subunit
MNFYQRALRYIRRTPTKTLLLILTFFVIGNLVILGLGVSQASDNAKILTRQKMRAVVNYQTDYDAYFKYTDTITDMDELNAAYQNMPKIDPALALQIAEDPRVKAYNYMMTYIAYGRNGLEHVPLGNEDNNNNTYTDENGNTVTYEDPGFNMIGNYDPEMIEFLEGTYQVTSGNMYTREDVDQEKNVCLITEELASVNNLRIGDTITLSNFSKDTMKRYEELGYSDEELSVDLEIIGIFTTQETVDPNSPEYRYMGPSQSPKNKVLMPLTAFTAYRTVCEEAGMKLYPESYRGVDKDAYLEKEKIPDKVTYLLDDPLHVEEFVKDYTPKIGEYLELDANNEIFKKMARPLDTMSFFAGILVSIVVLNAVVIISLVTALTLKNREYEIGVLLSIGVSKAAIVTQLFLELLLIAFVGFGFASISGSLMAGEVGDIVLDYQTTSESQYESDNDYINYSDSYFTEISQDDLLSEYHVSVSPLLIVEIFVLGTFVVLIAIIIPSYMIMRLNPKQILLQ